MNNRILIYLICCLALIIHACNNDETVSPTVTQIDQESAFNNTSKEAAGLRTTGAKQVSGVGFLATDVECDSPGQGATFAVRMTGQLEGCLFVFIEAVECSPSGTYREVGKEYFVGTYNGEAGTFWTSYKFEAKFEGCADDGSYLGAEIFGRCQHPVINGSGDGVFEGVTGRLDMKDDIAAGNYPYRGHFKF